MQKRFFQVDKNAIFRKTMDIVRNYRDIKLVTNEGSRSYFVLELNCQAAKKFFGKFISHRNKKDTDTYE